MKGAMTRRGGLLAYLGTDDGREVRRRIEAGDVRAEEVYRAMAYQIAKEIGAMAAVLYGKVDAIILTGGLPHPPLSDWIAERCLWIAPVRIHAGERELLALGRAAARHVCEGEALMDY
jgi:butyrate kinase